MSEPADGVENADPRTYDTVTLLSDLGTADGFVGVIHSVIRQMAPGAGVVDLTHGIAPFDVRAGSLVLARSVQFLCPGVIIGMVDPSVGTEQRAIALEVAGGAAVLLGPDNGLLAPAVGMIGGAERAVVLDNTDLHLPTASTTFPGRDIYAPVAAHLCNGVAFADLGSEVDPGSLMPGLVPLTSLEQDADGVDVLGAEVLWVDHFGNVQLNVDPDELDGWGDRIQLRIGTNVRTATRITAFGQLTTGEIGLLVDADGLVAVVTDRHPAAEELGLATGDAVALSPIGDDQAIGVRTAVTIGRRDPASTPPGGAS
ncbi:MAG TPA: SAM-dependent chlorinase/fluorinase [Microthrixaceae bacterium]|nr:SAM-dependent chlorinase/fluorinase [Microthrixaceae bacterium]